MVRAKDIQKKKQEVLNELSAIAERCPISTGLPKLLKCFVEGEAKYLDAESRIQQTDAVRNSCLAVLNEPNGGAEIIEVIDQYYVLMQSEKNQHLKPIELRTLMKNELNQSGLDLDSKEWMQVFIDEQSQIARQGKPEDALQHFKRSLDSIERMDGLSRELSSAIFLYKRSLEQRVLERKLNRTMNKLPPMADFVRFGVLARVIHFSKRNKKYQTPSMNAFAYFIFKLIDFFHGGRLSKKINEVTQHKKFSFLEVNSNKKESSQEMKEKKDMG